jgi:hypothetical protein
MAITKTTFAMLFLLCAGMSACVKNANNGQHGGGGSRDSATLTLSKSSVKRGEQVMVSTNLANTGTLIKWKTNATAGAIVSPANSQAAVIFALAGTYNITASYYNPADTVSAYDSSSSPVVVTDSIYTPSNSSPADTTNLSGSVALTPILTDSGLIIMIQTGNLYDCTSYLTAYGWTEGGPTLNFDFSSAEVVLNSINCGGARNPANAIMFFLPLADGYYPVTAELNQVNYSGGLSISGTVYTFTWNYTSGITISPQQVSLR